MHKQQHCTIADGLGQCNHGSYYSGKYYIKHWFLPALCKPSAIRTPSCCYGFCMKDLPLNSLLLWKNYTSNCQVVVSTFSARLHEIASFVFVINSLFLASCSFTCFILKFEFLSSVTGLTNLREQKSCF